MNARLRNAAHRGRPRLGLALAVLFSLTLNGTASASVTKNLAVTHAKETDKKWCVPASVWMEIKQIGETPPSQQSLYTEGLQYKRCNVGVDSGLDPLAWAWLLYWHTSTGHYYDDFTYTGPASGTLAMANQLFNYNEVAGALVNEGHHAMVFKGATTSCDLSQDACWQGPTPTVSTVYVDDPWYNWNVNTPGHSATDCQGTGGSYECGKIGLAPNTAITYSTWSSWYYTAWNHQNCAYWNGKWVSVLRKASGGPSFATQPKDGSNGPTPDPDPGVEYAATTQPTVEVAAASPEVNDLDHAFQVAKVKHGLQDRTELTAALAEGHVRSVVKVRSMVTTFPDYLLATVVGRGGLKGVAMFTLADPSHPEFAGMTYSDEALPRYPLVSASDARRLLRTSGVVASGEPTLVWGWSAETNSPYYPMWQVNTKSGTRFITSTGNVIADPEFQAPLAR